ncbi:MAG: ABC transporter substrate-binding protein [Synergistaceae bacterium]|jgi:peptide/nickel transport system substrate-binding protein|nr:ABC transporter substrate-binding protein [Synergistaceae bacterium]
MRNAGKRIVLPLFVLALAVTLFSGSAFAAGVIRVAVIDEPPTLDQHVVTSDLATMIAQHIFEGLYTFDSKYSPVPMLVQDEEIRDAGKIVVLRLREGVKFHDGSDFDAEDALASLKRWGEHGARGSILFNNREKIEATGKLELTLTFKAPYAPWKNLLAFINGGPVIYPKEVIDGADKTPIDPSKYIGTGPYKFAERNVGRYIKLVRNDAYAARTEPADGYAGNREAILDEIRFIPVPDAGTRLNGVKAGDYDYAEQMLGDLFDSLKEDDSVKVSVNQGANQGLAFFNSSAGVFKDNYKLRQALEAALDMEPALRAAIGPQELWKATGSMMPDTTEWYSAAGLDNYSQNNAELAKKLAKEAGYNGEKIVFMASTSYKIHYDTTLVLVKQLQDAGFNVDHQIFDWATLVSKRADPAQWDIFFTHHGFVPDPVLFSFMSDAYPGWWATDAKAALSKAFVETMDFPARKGVWDKLQALIYEEVPVVKVGDYFSYDIYSPKVQGLSESSLIWPKFWGVSIP